MLRCENVQKKKVTRRLTTSKFDVSFGCPSAHDIGKFIPNFSAEGPPPPYLPQSAQNGPTPKQARFKDFPPKGCALLPPVESSHPPPTLDQRPPSPCTAVTNPALEAQRAEHHDKQSSMASTSSTETLSSPSLSTVSTLQRTQIGLGRSMSR